MKKQIIITSIFKPTEAVKLFGRLKEYELTVVGDLKSPVDWQCTGVNYLSLMDQSELSYKLRNYLPFNHYSRKMLGYLTAISKGAEYIVDTDDDNIPKPKWRFPEFDGHFDFLENQLGFINIYQLYTNKKIWPRGLPLKFIKKDFKLLARISKKIVKVGIWQGLADEDPDVDAIYRLTDDSSCYFDDRDPVVLGKKTISPFNSQNTMVRKELFSLLYLPTFVTFRFTDILRGLVAQPIMWLYDYHLGFTNATVIQKRNPHDYMDDFLSEIPMYQFNQLVIDIVSNSISSSQSIESNLYNAYDALLKAEIVCDKEIVTLEAWLDDLKRITNNIQQSAL